MSSQAKPIPTDHRSGNHPDAATDALAALHTRTVDTIAGYRTMVEKAEPSFRATPEAFLALHVRHADGLARVLARHDRVADADGTFMGTINRAVVSVRAMFDDIDADLMSAIRNGESHVLTAFDAALEHTLPHSDAAELDTMRGELRALLASHPSSV